MTFRSIMPFLIAAVVAVPGIVLRLAGVHLDPPLAALFSGMAIVGASFLLLWACDAAQADISQALALAVVALIAVLPEYAVDMYFTWQAGKNPESSYAHYAVANMTGANRLLIGVAWSAIAVIFFVRYRNDVRIDKERRTELLFLALATIYAFVIPIKGSLAWYDGLVFLGLYAWYISLASRRPCVEVEGEGPAEVLVRLPKGKRRLATGILFVFAAGAILANAEPFCEGLIGTGKALKINEFLLLQWLAPVASEAPEFIVALVFAWRGKGGLALGSLLSSKLNQWTLLVGMIPGVFALSHGTLAHPIPMGQFQMHEILLTAAQSLLAVVMLACLRFTLANALLLFTLFIGQLVVPSLVDRYPETVFGLGLSSERVHLFFSVLYVMGAVAIFLERPSKILSIWRGIRIKTSAPERPVEGVCENHGDKDQDDIKTPHCTHCRWRQSGIRALRSESQAQVPTTRSLPVMAADRK
jgi:cation:H+ antiporter